MKNGKLDQSRAPIYEALERFRKMRVDLSDQRSDRACLVYKLYSDSENRIFSSDRYYFRPDHRGDKWGQVPRLNALAESRNLSPALDICFK